MGLSANGEGGADGASLREFDARVEVAEDRVCTGSVVRSAFVGRGILKGPAR